MWEEVFPNLQHMLSVRTRCRPTSLSAPLEAASSSSSISWRSSARRFFSGRDKSAASLLLHTSCWGGPGVNRIPKTIQCFSAGPLRVSHVSPCWTGRWIFLWREKLTGGSDQIMRCVPWTLTYLDVPVDKILLSLLALGRATATDYKLLFPGLLVVCFKWSTGVAPLFTCQTSIYQKVNSWAMKKSFNNHH